MILSDIMNRSDLPAIEILGISSDSRSVRRGYLFVAIPGTIMDGREYIEDAIRHGAKAILAPIGTEPPVCLTGVDEVVWINDENPRLALAQAAARFYGAQPETIVAVTGTNGKTSTVTFTRQIWQHLGYRAASLGTLGLEGGSKETVEQSGSMTTPDPVRLHAQLADLAESGIDHLAIEASSHGLDQYRLDGMNISAAGFTNVTHDHLDYHGSMENYASSKRRLFDSLLKSNGVAVVNADSPESENIRKICEGRGITFWSYGHQGKELRIISRLPNPNGQHLVLEIFGQEIEFTLPLVGEFQVMNMLCAAGLVLARCQKRLQEVIDILPKLKGVPGRLEFVPGHKQGAAVYVDYAHTPDALENILKALRPHTQKMLVCVFGCGGNRDKAKRPVMGRIAAQLADINIITDDNPRNENAAQIRAEIKQGAPQATEIADRRQAIETAVKFCKSGDVLVIAGKGHEHGQIVGDHVEPFDDVNEAHLAMETS
ncbi:MAG: UDP-N-acetylmuramoyl-L-alanyl-D-glutamate--2,6-diaminopimelate ligase [Micavibrio aeruginosavorus]|uniref:UDP-N-acetylmuramoyl-L-alanyl-D-glutamate--2,6-diaminopimelate ligase n=1 Tax=Micavibrio aeruginosavorus TaxID=349221 RepID=A0A2W5FLB3_9BACT|nr:MAG: UDP-N-acetylmuramoyl-L-alanyl-D-glutamate--2,6-diaminopimelate ligase [Micavibrio aeruginosavorus]